MLRAAAFHHTRLDALIERHQPPAVRHGQREQVNVCHLLMPLQATPIESRRVCDGKVIRPERVVAAALQGAQSVQHLLRRWGEE